MGATGSSNIASPPPISPTNSPSLTEQGGERNECFYDTTQVCCPDYTNENTRQRTRETNVNEEPRSQGPSPYTTIRREDWWNERPSAPSLSNLRPPHQETLLTYAAHMTGWQTAEGNSPPYGNHREAMEYSRVISQLAMANHQLASAHTATLAHLEVLYSELRKEREARRRGSPSAEIELHDEALQKRLMEQSDTNDEDIQERQRLELRIDKLENQLAENDGSCYSKNGSLRFNEVRQLQHRIERLENSLETQGFAHNGTRTSESHCCLLDNANMENEEDRATKIPHIADTTKVETINNTVLDSCTVPESETKSETPRSQADYTSDAELHLPNIENANTYCDQDGKDNKEDTEIDRLTKEIERLKAERSEYQSTNQGLLSDLTEKESVIEKLVEQYEESKSQYKKVEASLSERSEECDALVTKFETARQEIERLVKEIDAGKFEKDTAQARISTLEQDLQSSIMEKEKLRLEESLRNSELKAQLDEEVSDKEKQKKALEDALDEIQRLKETIKTEGTDGEDETSREDNSTLEPTEEAQQGSSDRVTNLDDFKKELTVKREARQRAIAAVSSEMERLRKELDAEKEAHSETSRMLELLRSAQGSAQTEEVANAVVTVTPRRSRIKEEKPDEHEIAMKQADASRLNNILKVSDELRNDIRLQLEKLEDLRYQLERDREHQRLRIRCLEEVTNKTKEALGTRECRANELKDHLAQILVRLGDRSFLDGKDDIGRECERQLENINSLKSLYNERLKVLTELKEAAVKELADVKERLDYTEKKSECLEEDLKKADEKIDAQDTEIINLESQLGLAKADCRDLQNQMSLINGIFTQMLLGASSADMDLDRLTQLLKENHDLISDMAKEESTEAAALPKLLLDLIEQVEGKKNEQRRAEPDEEIERREDDRQQEDIAHNLPKVWRVLFELLSCHAVDAPTASAVSSSDPNTCYKSVDTPAGPRLVISVSKTYIHLKELILEKKHLEKEMNRMKQLNSHLECKLGEQEKRLSTVSEELTKTWNIVDRMQAQHQQLHTHEKILRYELQQKRKMLQELKQELEYCREKWESARQKNTNTEIEWRSLRREFAARKAMAAHDSFNNSAESGFSDERGDDSDEEDEEVEGRVRLGPRKRARKESPRLPSPDTESEQPTDTELSDPKTGSSVMTEQRTPTPETEAELDEIEITDTDLDEKVDLTDTSTSAESPQEPMDPLDQALTNMIQNLIKLDSNSKMHIGFTTSDQVGEMSETAESAEEDVENSDKEAEITQETSGENIEVTNEEEQLVPVDDLQLSKNNEDLTNATDSDGEKAKTEDPLKPSISYIPVTCSPSLMSTMPVFTIGPIPEPSVTVKSVQFSDPLIVGPSNRFFAPVFGSPTSSDLEQQSDHTKISPLSDCSTSIKGCDDVETKSLAEKHVFRPSESISDSDNISVDSSSSLETVKEFPARNSIAAIPSSSTACQEPIKTDSSSKEGTLSNQEEQAKVKATKSRTPEEALAAREDRLKRLEEQAEWLMKKMNATSRRGSALSTRLEELHETYGEPPVPPPMPDVLPSRRLQTNLTELPPPQVPESSSSAQDAKNNEKSVLSEDSGESPPDNAP